MADPSDKAWWCKYMPDKYISAVAGKLTAEEQGLYWMICSLIMSDGGAVDEDHRRFGALCLMRPSRVAKVLDSLVDGHGKLTRNDGKVCQKVAESVVESAQKRVQSARENGSKGGRPSSKTNDLDKPAGSEKNNPSFSREEKNRVEEERSSPTGSPPIDENDDLGLTTEQSAPVIPLNVLKRPDRSPEMFTIWRGHFELIWPGAMTLRSERVKALNARLIDTFGGDIEKWREFCQRCAATPFLVGENDRNWRAPLKWLLQPENIAKVLDGNYDNLATNRGYGSNVQRSDRRLSPHDAMVAGFARAAGYDTDGTGDR
jgi:hypothetical protein